MFGIVRKRTSCSCSERSDRWSWPFTRAHEKYNDQIVTTVTCLKHAWSVRLYDDKNMRFLTAREEGAIVQKMQAGSAPVGKIEEIETRSSISTMAHAGV